jgi:hypothetical protein
LATRRRSDPGKLAITARLRSETTPPIKWIAARVQTGTAKGAESVRHHLHQSQDQRKTASALEPCAQLEFQSTVGPFLDKAAAKSCRQLRKSCHPTRLFQSVTIGKSATRRYSKAL